MSLTAVNYIADVNFIETIPPTTTTTYPFHSTPTTTSIFIFIRLLLGYTKSFIYGNVTDFC